MLLEIPSTGGVPRRGGVGQESEKACFLCKLSKGINKKGSATPTHEGTGNPVVDRVDEKACFLCKLSQGINKKLARREANSRPRGGPAGGKNKIACLKFANILSLPVNA